MFNKSVKLSLIVISIVSSVFITNYAQAAKGSGGAAPAGGGGGNNLITLPGECASAKAIGSGLLAKIDNNWQFAIQVAGPNAGGNWSIDWFKNGNLSYTSNETFPSGWASFGLAASKLTDTGTVTFSATATNRDNGEICTATISVKV
jgi:hypothetical protein